MCDDHDSGLRKTIGEEAHRKFRHEMAVLDVGRALHTARFRCLPFEELLTRLGTIWEDGEYSSVIYELCARDFTPAQEGQLSAALANLGQVGDRLGSREKERVDRAIGRVSKCLSPKRACEVVGPFLVHPRKARRQIAYRVLKAVPVTAEFAGKLIERHRQSNDKELLELIARSSEAVCHVDVHYLLESIGEEYWRARVIAALMAIEPAKAYALADVYPIEFVHAVGRLENRGGLITMRKLFKSRRRNAEFLSIYAWCLGILRAKGDLGAVEQAFKRLQRESQQHHTLDCQSLQP